MNNIFDCGYSEIRIDNIKEMGDFAEIIWYDLNKTSKYRSVVHKSLITMHSDEPLKGPFGPKYEVGGVKVDKDSYLIVYKYLLKQL